MAEEVYVRCSVSPGFFASEFYVVVYDSSAFVDKHSVIVNERPSREKSVDGKVLAYVVERRAEKTLVEIPGQAVVGGLRTWVPQKGIAAAA
jgi:hypothetical protein